MEALFFLIPLALLFCILTVKAFFWAVAHRQFDNLDSAARSILFDDDAPLADSTLNAAPNLAVDSALKPALMPPLKSTSAREDSHAA